MKLKSWFWLVAVSPQQDLLKWGKDGDVKEPYRTRKAAMKNWEYLKDTTNHKEDVFYILEVFSNGCMICL